VRFSYAPLVFPFVSVLAGCSSGGDPGFKTGNQTTNDASNNTTQDTGGGGGDDASGGYDAGGGEEDVATVPVDATCAGPVDAGPVDAGPVDSGSATHEAGTPDGSAGDSGPKSSCPGPSPTLNANGMMWTLTWSDEFNGPNGSAPDPTKWMVQTGDIGASNHELEYYTSDPTNVEIEDCHLVITTTTAGASNYTCNVPPVQPCSYTSGRLQTMGIFSQEYGRIEARMQLPVGPGLWPAFWALGTDYSSVGWPQCGEIDIMENQGAHPNVTLGALHGLYTPNGGPFEDQQTYYTVPSGQQNLAQTFHTYAIEWQPNEVRFYVDDNLYETRTAAAMPPDDQWSFNQAFFLILNVAVGGYGGSPDQTTVFPQRMLVDYIRAYQPL
jgi:beta-glucanase (GH16 family)